MRQLVPTFRAAGANREMLRALAYLAEAARNERCLDVVDIHLRLGEWDQAQALAEHLAGVFLKAEAPQLHAQAYASLRSAVANRSATAELIDYMRMYVKIAEDEQRPFEPPV